MIETSFNGQDAVISSVQEIIDEARNGRMFILVDDEDRENEGDLVIPAQMATPEKINFMATHGKGLVCLALNEERVRQLGLSLMNPEDNSRFKTAFTVSIEARDGVSTGISVQDRARTVAVAIDAAKGANDIVTPGHVFPLIARPGGTLVRAGHTEAAVDIARLAGLNPSGVICEIMKGDGSMARMADLAEFARCHDLKIGTIRDLIAHRRVHDNNVECTSRARFASQWGKEWDVFTFRIHGTGNEAVALVKGDLAGASTPVVRMHALDFFSDVIGQTGDRSNLIARSMRIIANEGCGVIVIFQRDVDLSQLLRVKAGAPLADVSGLRDYGVGAQVLAELGVKDMALLSNSRHTPVALQGYGLNIVEHRPL